MQGSPPSSASGGDLFERELLPVATEGLEVTEPQPDVEVPGRAGAAFLEQVKGVLSTAIRDWDVETGPVTRIGAGS